MTQGAAIVPPVRLSGEVRDPTVTLLALPIAECYPDTCSVPERVLGSRP